jgi:hypothetical protein
MHENKKEKHSLCCWIPPFLLCPNCRRNYKPTSPSFLALGLLYLAGESRRRRSAALLVQCAARSRQARVVMMARRLRAALRRCQDRDQRRQGGEDGQPTERPAMEELGEASSNAAAATEAEVDVGRLNDDVERAGGIGNPNLNTPAKLALLTTLLQSVSPQCVSPRCPSFVPTGVAQPNPNPKPNPNQSELRDAACVALVLLFAGSSAAEVIFNRGRRGRCGLWGR